MKTVNVAKLKSDLSHYLKIARSGEEVIVTSHDHPVAKLVPLEERVGKLTAIAAKTPASALKKIKGVKLRNPIDVVAMIRKDRDSRDEMLSGLIRRSARSH